MNSIVFDMNKVAYAKLFYRDQLNTTHRHRRPTYPTAFGERIPDELMEIATRRELIDEWTPVVRVQMTNSHSLEYEGKRALGIWREWCRRQYGKRKKII